ncbi:MAG: hypothetical protein JST04_10375 [Bdellovibrionales bacterium]|nr:hypothetical protein [Bdellovibrionales bacterium]
MILRRRGNHRHDREEEGFVLLQVVAGGLVMLALLLTGFQTVRNTIRLTNTVATSSEFKDYVMAVQQELAMSQTCLDRLFFPPGTNPLLTAVNLPAGYTVSVRDRSNVPMAWEEGAGGLVVPPLGRRNPVGFKVTELRLRDFQVQGWSKAPNTVPGKGGYAGTEELERWTANLSIVAVRRSDLSPIPGVKAPEMRANIPLLFGVRIVPAGVSFTRRLANCSSRDIYQVPLGPPGTLVGVTRKSGIECIDRGGMPIVWPGSTYYVCKIPVSSWALCKTAGVANAPNDYSHNLPGWFCLQASDAAEGFTYVY